MLPCSSSFPYVFLLRSCPETLFYPVCDAQNQQTFTSPCAAGCVLPAVGGATGVSYEGCACATGEGGVVLLGECEAQCDTYVPYLIIVALCVFCTFLNASPATTLVLRSTPSSFHPVALGLRTSVVTLIGVVPASLLYDWLFISSCREGAEVLNSCGDFEACMDSNYTQLSLRFSYAALGPKLLSAVFFYLAHRDYKRR